MPRFLEQSDNTRKLAYLLSEGLTDQQIADDLAVSKKSVSRWKKDHRVIDELDNLNKNKTQILQESWQERQKKYQEQVQIFTDRTVKDIGIIRTLNSLYLSHIIEKLKAITHEDIPAKMLPVHLRTCLEMIKVCDELESTKLCVGEIITELDKHHRENEN